MLTGNLIRWGSKRCPTPAYAIYCGDVRVDAALVTVLMTGRNTCTEVESYPRGALVVVPDGDAVLM